MPEQDNSNSAFNPAADPPEMKVGLFGRIMGQKHQQNLRKESRSVEFLMDQLKSAAESPDKYPPEVVELLITNAGKYLGPDIKTALKGHFDQLNAKRDVERRQAMLPGHEPQQQQQPQGGMAGALGGGAPQAMPEPAAAPQGDFSPMAKTQLLKLVQQAQQQGNPSMPMAPAPQGPQGQQQPPGMPPRPSEAGGPAGAAPAQPQDPAPAIQKASALGATGFNVPPPAPVQPDRGGWFNSPAQRGANAAAVARPTFEAKGEVEAVQAARDYEARKARYQNEPWYKLLSDRQKAELIGGEHIAPEPHYNIAGQVESDENDRDYLGNPVAPGTLGNRRVENGKQIFQASIGVTHRATVEDANSPTGWSQIELNRANREVGRLAGVPPPAAYAPTTTSSSGSGTQWIQVGDHWEPVSTPRSTQTTVQRTPSTAGAPRPTAPAPAGAYDPFAAGQTGDFQPSAVPPPPATPRAAVTPRSGATIPGPNAQPPAAPKMETAAAWKARIENEYTPNGQRVMSELFPRMEMIKRLITYLEPNKNDDIPASHLLDTLAYRMGYKGNTGGFLSQLQLGSIGQAGALIKGVSRAREVLDKAMIHTPAAWKDSSAMMYAKLAEIYRNMEDMKKGVDTYEKKYPGLGTPPPGGITPPPSNETEAQKIERLARKHQ